MDRQDKYEAFLSATASVNDCLTWRGALMEGLINVLQNGEDVSTKRLWGNSGWQDEVAAALAEHIEPAVVASWEGEGDDKYPDDIDWDKYGEVLAELIGYLFLSPKPVLQ